MPGFHTIDTSVAPQQLIAVLLLNIVVAKLFFRVELVTLWEFVNQSIRQLHNITRGGVMIFGRPARDIHVFGVIHPQRNSRLIHALYESVLAPGNVFHQGHCRIITRLDNHAAQQLFKGNFFTQLHEHARAFHFPSFFAD